MWSQCIGLHCAYWQIRFVWAFTAQHLHSHVLSLSLFPTEHATSPITLTTATTSNCALSHVDKLLLLPACSLPPPALCTLLKLSKIKKISGSPRDISCTVGSAVDATWHLKVPLQVLLIWQPFWRRLCCCRPFLHTYAFVCVYVYLWFFHLETNIDLLWRATAAATAS